TGITVQVRVRGMDVVCKVRLVDQYGNAPLYLLDTNFPGSEHGWMTNRLYGGQAQDRVAQEIILGIGGVKALRALNIPVDLYHFNEGHAVFAGVELIREKMQDQGLSFDQAWKESRQQIVFTTHTPVAAGNEEHGHDLLQLMDAYNGLSYDQMRTLGGDPFNMTVAALRLSTLANAVSKLHGQTARKMWHNVWEAAPLISVTNGVHMNTWQDSEVREAFKAGQDLWAPHLAAKSRLIEYVKNHYGSELREDVLLVGFARRAAPYKRSDLIFRDTNLISQLLNESRIQLIFSGKAHPNDTLGKDIIQDLVKMDRQYKDNVVFLENYNMEIAKLMVQGCDVWLNNPRRPLEASGTSGMKAAMNGVLNLSVVDGWVAEGPQHGVSGWLISDQDQSAHHVQDDERDLRALYKVLLQEVIPTYYDNREMWKEMMLASIDMAHWQFSSRRMLNEYYDVLYNRVMELQAQHQPQAFKAQAAVQEQEISVWH
ncbi:MAG TPA: alpha-glucan family phosphorylase, partial [Bacillota bacterium]|nr:alpha-glucan family phosphorylase [Bacillota bacterium]